MAVGVASPTPLNILAGIAGQGGTPSLAFFAPVGSTLPVDATTALASAFLTAGYIAETGLTISTAINSQDITAFGVTVPVRTLITSAKKTGKLTFLETNGITQALYRLLPLPGQTGGVTVGTGGTLALAEGPARAANYAAVFIATDGVNVTRKVCPNLSVTDLDDEQIAQNAVTDFGVTFTTYPDSSGNTVYTYYSVPNLATV